MDAPYTKRNWHASFLTLLSRRKILDLGSNLTVTVEIGQAVFGIFMLSSIVPHAHFLMQTIHLCMNETQTLWEPYYLATIECYMLFQPEENRGVQAQQQCD